MADTNDHDYSPTAGYTAFTGVRGFEWTNDYSNHTTLLGSTIRTGDTHRLTVDLAGVIPGSRVALLSNTTGAATGTARGTDQRYSAVTAPIWLAA